jgi:hypothetical protein
VRRTSRRSASHHGDGATGVHDRSGRDHTRARSDPAEVHRREWRRPDERAGRARLDQEHVDPERVDGLGGLHPEAVRESGEYERHREDDCSAEHRDDKSPFPPLHVAQGSHQHGIDVTDAS